MGEAVFVDCEDPESPQTCHAYAQMDIPIIVCVHYGTMTLTYIEKTKIPDPEMDAKSNSKTLLLINFFNFFEPFRSRLASKFAKSAYMTPRFFHKIQDRNKRPQN